MKKLNYDFQDAALWNLALTQSGADAVNNNERLEFLGDRVLGLSVASLLYAIFPTETEGELARRHANLVSTKTLAGVARELGFDKQMRHGHMTGGRTEHIAANAMEAVLGAIYLDGGFEAARAIVVELWTSIARADVRAPKDPKTELQEVVQHADSGALPVYEFLEESGKTHAPVFSVRVSALDKSATGQGASKKSATAAAATNLLKIIS